MPDAGAGIDTHFGSVRVYTLIDPSVLYEHARVIAGELFGVQGTSDGVRVFGIHPASGYVSYFDHSELWQNARGEGLPAGRNEVEAIARDFLQTANRKIVGSRPLQKSGVPALFPEDLRVAWIGGAVPNASSTPDHCFCQFGVYLPADRKRTARVEGAAIDVRIGRGGKVIGLSSRWRQITGDVLSTERSDADGHMHETLYADSPGVIAKPAAAAVPAIGKPAPATPLTFPGGGDEDAGAPAEFVYWLADENAPQTFLAPVRLSRAGGHHGALEPASAHSLLPDIWHREAGGQLEALAVVRGGSGSYAYQWGYWAPAASIEGGLISLGTSQSVSFPRGACTVVLQVRDTLTGAVAQTEKSIFPIGDATV